MTDDWRIESRVLKTGLLQGSHSAQNLCKDFVDTTEEYGLKKKKIVCVTDSAPNMVSACQLTGNIRYPCIAHKINLLVQKDLMTDPLAKPLRELIKKVREGQSKLLYRHEELKRLREEDNQNKFALFLSELSELDDICDAEARFQNISESETIQVQNDFTGLKSINDIRWNCTLKVAKCYLDNASELKI